jgi:hypothetical protein
MELSQRNKTILLVFVFILIISVVAYLMYIIFFKPIFFPEVEKKEIPIVPGEEVVGPGLPQAAVAPPVETEEEIKEELKQAQKKQLKDKISTEQDVSVEVTDTAKGGFTKSEQLTTKTTDHLTLGPDGNSLKFYNNEDNRFYKIDEFGNLTALSDKKFYNVENTTWAPTKNQGIIEYPDGSNIFYDFDQKKQLTLPKHWQEFSFSKNSEKIAFKSIGLSKENNWLAISNPDKSSMKIIEPIGNNSDKVIVDWSPNNQVVAFYKESIDYDRQELYFLGKNNENFKLSVTEGRGFIPKWAPDGKKLLYSVWDSTDNYKPSLWMVDGSPGNIGNNRTRINVKTWADRCSFNNSGNYIYCSVPIETPEWSGPLPNLINYSYQDQEGNYVAIPSKIVKINTTNNQTETLAIPDDLTNITKVYVNDTEDTLYYRTEDKNLRKINLK